MTIKKKTIAKRTCAVMLSLAIALPTGIPAVNVKAAPDDSEPAYKSAYATEGYEYVWGDEFDGNSLNLEDWNVEAHEPGWVNAELQSYPDKDNMSKNIAVKDGNVVITPTASKKGEVDLLDGKSFDSTWEKTIANWGTDGATADGSADFSNGNAIVVVKDSGNANWHIQIQKKALSIVEGHKYSFSVKASSTKARKTEISVLDPNNNYHTYNDGNTIHEIATEESRIAFEFTADSSSDTVALQFNLGLINNTVADSSDATVTFSDVKLIDLTASESASGEMIDGKAFDTSWEKTIANWGSDGATADGSVDYADGKAVVTINNSGTANWHIQVQKKALSIIKDHKYKFSVKASSTKARKTEISVLDPDNNYHTYNDGKTIHDLAVGDNNISFEFTADASSSTVALQFNFGLINGSSADSSAAVVTLSDVSLIDLSAEESAFNYKDYDYSSGRINTQGKHDFTYGRFESRLKVPKGKGYLPAFWLMASDESNYGQWPQCGEIDIMEVMGQQTDLSYHTIHYGYSSSAHKQNQAKYKLAEDVSDFCDEYHTYILDWEPGKLTWYVDGVDDNHKVFETSDWYTGKDDESQLAYPAPFDQNFYVILNLAVGGSWVGYPDKSVVDNIIEGGADQSFYVDYVRVYQKDKAEYDQAEETVEKPAHEEVYRKPDSEGNYVINGDFVNAIEEEEVENENKDTWVLHKESDAQASTATVAGGVVTFAQSAVGDQDYSLQLKQTGIPMYKGWEYELTFDAWADEARTMIVEVEGPDRGWVRYFPDTTVNLTTEKQSFKYNFTMPDTTTDGTKIKTDANGSLEFNLGKQGSTSPVHISNVKLIHKSGEEIVEETKKTVRADGNYLYNGTFDQGDGRLGYWEFAEADKDKLSVSNKKVEGTTKRIRELCVKAPEGTSTSNPVIIAQSELDPLVAGKYAISYDAYMAEGGSSDAITVDVLGNSLTSNMTTESKIFTKSFELADNKTREQSKVEIKITKPGTYYLDNISLVENAIIKNGYFNKGAAGFSAYIYSSDLASGKVTTIDGNSVYAMNIKNTGDLDWYIQLMQDGVVLEKGKSYKFSIKAKSSVERQIKIAVQCNGGLEATKDDWTNYSGTEAPVTIGNEWTTFTRAFTMDRNDKVGRFSVTMGAVGGTQIENEHTIYLDDIVVEEIDAAKAEADKAKADAFAEKIASVDLTEEGGLEAFEAADSDYEKLTDDQKAWLNDDTLATYNDNKKEYVDIKNAAKADAVVELIKAIGTVEATDASKAAIDAAKAAYEALTDDQKKFIDDATVAKIADAEVAYAKAVEAKAIKDADDKKKAEEAAKVAADKAAADAVIAKINAIGTVTATDASKAAIEEATKAYIALTDDQKLLVDATTFQKLNDAKKAYDTAVAAQTATPAEDKGKTDNDGKAEKGETAVTDKGTFTATSATTASFTPSAEAKAAKTLVVPDTATIDGQTVKVTSVPAYAFKGAKNLTSLTIGANVTSLGAGVAQNATKLATVKFKTTNLTSIGANAFAGDTSLASIDLSKQTKLITIGANAFNGCKKCKIIKIYANKLKTVKKSAFKGAKNNKNVKVFVYAKNKTIFNKVVKLLKKAGLSKATFKFSKKK